MVALLLGCPLLAHVRGQRRGSMRPDKRRQSRPLRPPRSWQGTPGLSSLGPGASGGTRSAMWTASRSEEAAT
eukprot:10235136-Lingulodinium_polyedra.AAC.1